MIVKTIAFFFDATQFSQRFESSFGTPFRLLGETKTGIRTMVVLLNGGFGIENGGVFLTESGWSPNREKAIVFDSFRRAFQYSRQIELSERQRSANFEKFLRAIENSIGDRKTMEALCKRFTREDEIVRAFSNLKEVEGEWCAIRLDATDHLLGHFERISIGFYPQAMVPIAAKVRDDIRLAFRMLAEPLPPTYLAKNFALAVGNIHNATLMRSVQRVLDLQVFPNVCNESLSCALVSLKSSRLDEVRDHFHVIASLSV
jgi:hypothetical protein